MTSAEEDAAQGRYERTDARALPLFSFALSLALIIAASMGICAWVAALLSPDSRAHEDASPLLELREPPPGPALQARPGGELAAVRAREEALLGRTAWIDPVNGIVRIPIERAMELVASEGWSGPRPATPQEAPAGDAGKDSER